MSPRRLRVPPSQDRSLRRLRSRSPQSHQWNRELLEPGQAHAKPLQRQSESPLSPLSLKETEFRFNFGTPRPSNAGPNSRPCQPHLGQPLPHLLVHRNNRSTLASDPDQFPVRARGTAHDDREASVFPANAVKGWPIREPLADHPKEATNYHFRSADFSRQCLLTSLGGGSVRRLTPFSTSGLGVQCWIVECQRNADARRNCYPRDAAVNNRRSRCRVLRQSSLQCKSCCCCRGDRRPPVLTRMHSS